MDCAFEFIGVDEGLMGELIRLEVAPDWLDIVEFRGILGQPLDGEPVGASGKRRQRDLARVDRTIVLDEHRRLGGLPRFGTVKPIELLGWTTKSLLGLVGLVWTMSWRVT